MDDDIKKNEKKSCKYCGDPKCPTKDKLIRVID